MLLEMLKEKNLPELKSREEMLNILFEEEYGFLPPLPEKTEYEVKEKFIPNFCAGKAIAYKITGKYLVNGKEFSLTDYNFDAFKETKVLSFVEYCYSFYQNMQDNYGLYVYVYNPKGLKFVENSSLNQIQMAYGLQANQSYVKYPLLYLNSSTETNYEGLFYKFKVV